MEIRGNVKRRKSGTGTVGKTLLSILLLLAVAVGGYVIYMQANYYRIKNEVRQIVADEIERIKADPELSHLIKDK